MKDIIKLFLVYCIFFLAVIGAIEITNSVMIGALTTILLLVAIYKIEK